MSALLAEREYPLGLVDVQSKGRTRVPQQPFRGDGMGTDLHIVGSHGLTQGAALSRREASSAARAVINEVCIGLAGSIPCSSWCTS